MVPKNSQPIHAPAEPPVHSSATATAAPATPKQRAYLSYMGVTVRTSLTEKEATTAIQQLETVTDYGQWRMLMEKKSEWQTDRFLLHPDLFQKEFETYYQKELPEILCNYVRSKAPEAAPLLTPLRVRETMDQLSAQNPSWWRSPRRQHQFLMELVIHHPGLKLRRRFQENGSDREYRDGNGNTLLNAARQQLHTLGTSISSALRTLLTREKPNG